MRLLFLFALFSLGAFAHQTSLTTGNDPLRWPLTNIPFAIFTNTNDLDSTTAANLIRQSMAEWNATGAVNIFEAPNAINSVQFTSGSQFGSAIIGLTEVNYNSAGSITKATIYLNDTYNFTNTQNSFGSNVYLSDVVSHELGHLFGLSHSEVLSSTMFYTSFPGQSSIGADDRSAIKTKYNTSQGSISGRVMGGNSIGVLGVHVQAISTTTGEVVGVVTDDTGAFSIEGLDEDDSYYLYTSPIKNPKSLPATYVNYQTNFCPNAYVGSFYSACGSEYYGYPQVIRLTPGSPDADAGVVTINCGLKAHQDYSYQKVQTSFSTINIWDSALEPGVYEKAFVGYFFRPSTSSWSNWDKLEVDLTSMPYVPGRTLRLKLVAQPFGNQLIYEVEVYRNSLLQSSQGYTFNGVTGTYTTDILVDTPFSSTTSQNLFEIRVRAQKMTTPFISLTFPSSSTFTTDAQLPYLLGLGVRDSGNALENTNAILSDNQSCLDAPFTYVVAQTSSKSESTSDKNDDAVGKASAMCGTIGPPQGGGPGSTTGLIIIGFLIAFVLGHLSKKSLKY